MLKERVIALWMFEKSVRLIIEQGLRWERR